MAGSHVTKKQVKRYMKARELGNNQEIASAKAGISERTGRRIEGRESGVVKPHHWRTREDPLEQVWESEVVPLLDKEPALTPIALLEELQRRHPGEYPDAVQRTLQRRVKRWRAT